MENESPNVNLPVLWITDSIAKKELETEYGEHEDELWSP